MSEQDEHLAVHAELCRHEKGVVGGGISTIIALRARVAELEAETEVWRTSNAALTSECLTLRARVAALEQYKRHFHDVNKLLAKAQTRVAELEAKLAVADANLEIARANAASNDLAQETLRFRIAELVALLIEVVHCGGQCSAELLAKIERATQEEAGWTDIAGGAPGPEPRSPAVHKPEPPSSRRGEPAPDGIKEVMPNSGADRSGEPTQLPGAHNAQPRPAHPDPSTRAQDLSKGPAGAERVAELEHPWRFVDGMDWEYLFSVLGYGVRDKFWREVLTEMCVALTAASRRGTRNAAAQIIANSLSSSNMQSDR